MTVSAPVAPAPTSGIGHNSVQVPHDGRLTGSNGVQRDRPVSTLAGAKFRAKSFFRATGMSLAMADAGIIPAGHLVRENAMHGVLRHRKDRANERRSVGVNF